MRNWIFVVIALPWSVIVALTLSRWREVKRYSSLDSKFETMRHSQDAQEGKESKQPNGLKRTNGEPTRSKN